ncbi:MAG: type II toxin-antitoxin system VapC family toxin [Gemmatimonadota bacterium]
MSAIVIDASAVIELLLCTARSDAVAARILRDGVALHAPHLIDVEVAQVLRRYEHAGELRAPRAGDALADFADIRLERHPMEPMLGRIWALRHNMTAYDAAYVALAEALDAPLITCDARLGSAVRDATVEVL